MVFVVVTVFDPLELDTLTLDELLELRAAPAPLELVPLELVDALACPLDVDVLALDLDALAPARLAVLPLLDIVYYPHLLNFLYNLRKSD